MRLFQDFVDRNRFPSPKEGDIFRYFRCYGNAEGFLNTCRNNVQFLAKHKISSKKKTIFKVYLHFLKLFFSLETLLSLLLGLSVEYLRLFLVGIPNFMVLLHAFLSIVNYLKVPQYCLFAYLTTFLL